ncbi:hypothetical protein FXF51_00720 [Nonomuraea sp. PA05]|uniref:hypothetical protein n=1 Tax=Nonomuraea sp. PA05 TaxID=2604466 RepID=UPI0011D6AB07|nr:hypothetical protein [Nonomuraea sp. PA05]TYB70998.1 hypothetical protein FXF51_00720 [Nonomuraea sp. PA05]
MVAASWARCGLLGAAPAAILSVPLAVLLDHAPVVAEGFGLPLKQERRTLLRGERGAVVNTPPCSDPVRDRAC